METRSGLGKPLLVCGTLLVVAALVLVGYQMSLSAADIRDHRTQSATMLRDLSIDRVTLSEWEPPSQSIAWAALIGGFFLILTGFMQAPPDRSRLKSTRRDDLE